MHSAEIGKSEPDSKTRLLGSDVGRIAATGLGHLLVVLALNSWITHGFHAFGFKFFEAKARAFLIIFLLTWPTFKFVQYLADPRRQDDLVTWRERAVDRLQAMVGLMSVTSLVAVAVYRLATGDLG